MSRYPDNFFRKSLQEHPLNSTCISHLDAKIATAIFEEVHRHQGLISYQCFRFEFLDTTLLAVR